MDRYVVTQELEERKMYATFTVLENIPCWTSQRSLATFFLTENSAQDELEVRKSEGWHLHGAKLKVEQV